MLHAINQHKTRLHLRYLGFRNADETRVAEEDEITSLIMGPLAFLPACAIGEFWLAVVTSNYPEAKLAFPHGPVTKAEMHFWPRAHNIEPDLKVALWWGTEKRLLLVEFKWRAKLSGEDQLHKQWTQYLSEEERQYAWHIFIAPDTSEGSNALSRDIHNEWAGRLLLRSWFDILNTLNNLHSPLLAPWSAEITRFLIQLGIRPFRGFGSIEKPAALNTLPVNEQIFWKGFNGFSHLPSPTIPDINHPPSVFFTRPL